ncbi:MG032/MG096/MG288 family 1, partial [human gut metagenome]
MKKFLLFLLVLIIALVVASQFLLPSFIGSRIES